MKEYARDTYLGICLEVANVHVIDLRSVRSVRNGRSGRVFICGLRSSNGDLGGVGLLRSLRGLGGLESESDLSGRANILGVRGSSIGDSGFLKAGRGSSA